MAWLAAVLLCWLLGAATALCPLLAGEQQQLAVRLGAGAVLYSQPGRHTRYCRTTPLHNTNYTNRVKLEIETVGMSDQVKLLLSFQEAFPVYNFKR